MNTQVDELTSAELEELLKKRRANEAKQKERERKAYESSRDVAVGTLVAEAVIISETLATFKDKVHRVMDEQHNELSNYGGIRSHSKGGFSITHSDDEKKVIRYRDTEPTWDERAGKAVELLKDFLGDAVKKRDTDMYDILMSFLEKNQKGDLEYAKVFQLIKHRAKYQDERWVKGLSLLEESWGNHLKGYGYTFKYKDESGKWQSVIMNFSSL